MLAGSQATHLRLSNPTATAVWKPPLTASSGHRHTCRSRELPQPIRSEAGTNTRSQQSANGDCSLQKSRSLRPALPPALPCPAAQTGLRAVTHIESSEEVLDGFFRHVVGQVSQKGGVGGGFREAASVYVGFPSSPWGGGQDGAVDRRGPVHVIIVTVPSGGN